MPRAAWGLAVVLLISGVVAPAAAQPLPGPAVGGNATPRVNLPDPPLSHILPPDPPADSSSSSSLPPILGAPVRPIDREPQPDSLIRQVSGSRPDTANSTDASVAVTPVLNYQPPAEGGRSAVLGAPVNASPPISTPVAASTTTTVTTDPMEFLRQRSVHNNEQEPPDGFSSQSSSGKFAEQFEEKLNQVLGKRNEWFRSDHAFDGFISPVTNPFLFEDPRSLTEARPIFLIEKIPSGEPDFHGGETFFIGTQLRLAITDRLSFVIEKFGFESFNPGSGSAYPGDTGFAEFWFGPKYTFIRNESTGTLLAGGLQFQIPTGNRSNFQDTGNLSLVPYVSYAQCLLRDFSPGSFNFMASGGYSFSVNNERSDYLYLSAHLDMNVLNLNHFFPLVEMNWFINTTNGNTTPVGIEGQDLINFGGQARGEGLLTIAVGGRYKFSECYQFGAAFEAPLAGPKQLMDYRFTMDFIFRY